MTKISAIPAQNDIDADYSPQYVKLARLLRNRIKSGEYKHDEPVPATALTREHGVSAPVALHALGMLAANGYVGHATVFEPYRVIWSLSPDQEK